MGCRVGDIIVINNYISHGVTLSRHSFVVLGTENGQIQGLDYDLVCNVMSSFHSEEHRGKKLEYKGNLEYTPSDQVVEHGNNKRGFIKADQIYYFNSDTIDYYVIGNITPGLFNAILELAQQLESVEHITDNLRPG